MKYLLALILLLSALPAMSSTERTHASSVDIVTTAKTWLENKSKEDNIAANFEVVGHVNDVQLNTVDLVSLQVANLKSGWLRSRVGIPVQVISKDKVLSTVTVWFVVHAPASGLVYMKNQTKGSAHDKIDVREGVIDLARTKGKAITSLDDFVGKRLKRSVISGQALQIEDFEPVPTLQAQQKVRIETNTDGIRLSVPGRVLNDANVGEVVKVLPTHAAQPVRARVVSNQVVIIEN
jgi:flagella basal body P-ring formation protein FlgA